jgi:hypothetical protein
VSATEPTRGVRHYGGAEDDRWHERGGGWLIFSGLMIALVAIMNFVEGIAAVSNSKFYVAKAEFVFSGLNTWGWILIVVSAIQIATAIGVLLQWRALRWVGVAVVGVNAFVQLLFMPAYPLWSLALFAVDVLVIYALIAHGARR